ncbi:hypothetical protein B0H63DRAFT_564584 [Podospora didyma]|uniref:Uncharacterized protein n=1 Tax=Podospora didyma TaxID=330526 RepID=A0AAE0K6V6_9PEZI|nr:hypothetical protein B0H63DRAFT_564584 [Podospora didyma]
MLSAALLALATVLGTAVVGPAIGFFRPMECNQGESAKRLCYTAPENTPQDVSLADVKYAANYLRSYGRQTKASRLFTMKIVETPGCGEWSLYTRGSVLITAKHVGMAFNSSQQAAALLGCATDGGSLGTIVNATNPAYTPAAYKALNAVSSGLVIKVVAAGL